MAWSAGLKSRASTNAAQGQPSNEAATSVENQQEISESPAQPVVVPLRESISSHRLIYVTLLVLIFIVTFFVPPPSDYASATNQAQIVTGVQVHVPQIPSILVSNYSEHYSFSNVAIARLPQKQLSEFFKENWQWLLELEVSFEDELPYKQDHSLDALKRACSKFVSVSTYGAQGDGITKDTDAFQLSINKCSSTAKKDCCIVYVPAGQYLISPINLTSNMVLYLDSGAEILGSQRVDDYPLIPALPSFGIGREVIVPLRYQPLLCAFYQTRILLTGKGTINGQGWSWWKAHIEERLEYTRPRLVEFYECAQVVITNLHFTQAPFWTIHPVYCDQVIIRRVRITSFLKENNIRRALGDRKLIKEPPNVDAVDPNSSTNVVISNCHFSVGDDCVSIKSGYNDYGRAFGRPSANITVRHCYFHKCHGVSIGSEMSGGVYNVAVYNNIFNATTRGVRLKTQRERGGVVKNILFTNLRMAGVKNAALEVNMLYTIAREQLLSMGYQGHQLRCVPVSEGTPLFQNIFFRNIEGTAAGVGTFMCLPEAPCRAVFLENVTIRGSKRGSCCFHAQLLTHAPPQVERVQPLCTSTGHPCNRWFQNWRRENLTPPLCETPYAKLF